MKKIRAVLLTMLAFFCSVNAVFADEISDIKAFFNQYLSAANTYQTNVPDFYANDARILRYVIQKDGSVYPTPLVIPMDEYKKQMKLNSKIAKLRNYKNNYNNIQITNQNGDYKLSADRTPSTSANDKLKSHFVIGKDASGKYVIKEEMMQTREQIFLSQIKKQEKK